MKIIYHFVEKDYFEEFRGRDEYFPANYKSDGFIHCTREPENVARVADFIIGGKPGEYLLLAINEEKVNAEVRYESAGPSILFPHIYGHLNMDALINILHFLRNEDGRFIFPSNDMGE